MLRVRLLKSSGRRAWGPALKGSRDGAPGRSASPRTASCPLLEMWTRVTGGCSHRRARPGRCPACYLPRWWAGSGQSDAGSLKVCGNVEGFRERQQEATQSSGLGLSPPPPAVPPPSLSPPSPGLPPPSPRAKAISVFAFFPCGGLS